MPQFTKVHVYHDNPCDYSHQEEHGDGPWDYSWEESRSIDLQRVSLTQDKKMYPDDTFTIPGEVKAGDRVYVLYMTYSWGDSFGWGEGMLEVLWVFTNENTCREAMRQIEENAKSYSVPVTLENGEKQVLHNPGSGYFERLESVDYESFIVEP